MKLKKGNSILKLLIIGFCLFEFHSSINSTPLIEGPNIKFDSTFQLAEPVTNCGTDIFTIQDTSYAYIFSGMDSTLKWSGIHKRCYKINLTSKVVTRLPDLPDSLGRIALSATRIGDKIYVLGGYHVFANGSEKSSSLVHEFDPIGDTFTLKKIILPVAIDDHVQLAYRDSLLYIIGGWSETKNVRNVQIYEPKNNKWLVGTPLPDNRYTAFGATGYIQEDDRYHSGTLQILGGASDLGQFPVKNYYISGNIDINKPDSIAWDIHNLCDSCHAYRAATIPITHHGAFVLGGSDSSYNYNASDYKSRKVLHTTQRGYTTNYTSAHRLSNIHERFLIEQGGKKIRIPMDIRDIGHQKWISKTMYQTEYKNLSVIAGGILNNQKVSDRLILITDDWILGLEVVTNRFPISIYPNPTNSLITIESTELEDLEMDIFNSLGEIVFTKVLRLEKEDISIEHLPKGVYIIKIKGIEGSMKIIKQ